MYEKLCTRLESYLGSERTGVELRLTRSLREQVRVEGLKAVPAERQLGELRCVLEQIWKQVIQLVVPQVQLLR